MPQKRCSLCGRFLSASIAEKNKLDEGYACQRCITKLLSTAQQDLDKPFAVRAAEAVAAIN